MSYLRINPASGMDITLSRGDSGTPRLRALWPLLSAMLAALLIYPAVWAIIPAYALPADTASLGWMLLFYIAAFTAIMSARGWKLVLPAVVGAAIILARAAYVVFSDLDMVIDGFVLTTNQIFSVWTANSPFKMPIYIVKLPPAWYGEICTLFLMLAALPIVALVCHAVRVRSLPYAFAAVLPLYALALCFTGLQPLPLLIAPLCALCALLFTRVASRRRALSAKRPVLAGGREQASVAGLVGLCVSALCLVSVWMFFPSEGYVHPVDSAAAQRGVADALARSPLFSRIGNAISGASEEVRLDFPFAAQRTGATMLRVWTQDQKPLYLKGYTGTVYGGDRWLLPPDAALEGVDDIVGDRNVHNFFSALADIIDGGNTNVDTSKLFSGFELKVDNIGANQQRIYAPYNLIIQPDQISGVRYVHDQFLRAGDFRGISNYALSAYEALSPMRVISYIDGSVRLVAGLEYAGSGIYNVDTAFQDKQSVPAELIFGDYSTKLNTDTIKGYYMLPLLNNMSAPRPGMDFIEAEAAYRRYMYYENTHLPGPVHSSVADVMSKAGLLRDYYSVDEMVWAVRDYLSDYTYTLEPEMLPAGADYIEHFLTQGREGYCMHFASAAVAMLRVLGVPARYADGYIVAADDYSEDGWANVADTRAHAWAEVYYHGIGWQPIEATPGFAGVITPGGADSSGSGAPLQPYDYDDPFSNPYDIEPDVSAFSPATPIRNADGGTTAPTALLSAAVVLIGLLLTLIIRRRVALGLRNARFAASDPNRALVSMYSFMRKLARHGVQPSEHLHEQAEKACFSQQGVDATERGLCRRITDDLARAGYDARGGVKRLAYKYILNLV